MAQLNFDAFITHFKNVCETEAKKYGLTANDVYFAELDGFHVSSYGGEKVCCKYSEEYETVRRISWLDFALILWDLGYNTEESIEESIFYGL